MGQMQMLLSGFGSDQHSFWRLPLDMPNGFLPLTYSPSEHSASRWWFLWLISSWTITISFEGKYTKRRRRRKVKEVKEKLQKVILEALTQHFSPLSCESCASRLWFSYSRIRTTTVFLVLLGYFCFPIISISHDFPLLFCRLSLADGSPVESYWQKEWLNGSRVDDSRGRIWWSTGLALQP